MAKEKKEKGGFVKEFKAFIARGNVLDMAVGVIIGGAFNAIVTALVNILMSLATWGLPGGIKGLVTVLPAANSTQKGLNPDLGLGQKFDATKLQDLATALAKSDYGEGLSDESLVVAIGQSKELILSKYTLHGTTYTYNLSSVIDWGSFINAVISFLIIALTLFIIVKAAASFKEKREKFDAELKEKVRKELEEEKANEKAEEAKA